MAKKQGLQRYVLVESESCDWYVIPQEKLKEWNDAELSIADNLPEWAQYVELHRLTFTDPISS